MNNAIRWLRISYWTGAIIDGLAAVQMLVPALFAATNDLPTFRPSVEYRYAMGMGASLMLGWTALLLWADRKPVERRGILLITIMPVIVGMVVNELWAVVGAHFLPVRAVVPVWIVQVLLITLFALSYVRASRATSPR